MSESVKRSGAVREGEHGLAVLLLSPHPLRGHLFAACLFRQATLASAGPLFPKTFIMPILQLGRLYRDCTKLTLGGGGGGEGVQGHSTLFPKF